MSEKLEEEFEKRLVNKYFLLKKSEIWWVIGGFICFLTLAGVISYKSVILEIEASAVGKTAQHIQELKMQSEADAAAISKMRGKAIYKLKVTDAVQLISIGELSKFPLGKHDVCYLSLTSEERRLSFCQVKYENEWTLIAMNALCNAQCIDLIPVKSR